MKLCSGDNHYITAPLKIDFPYWKYKRKLSANCNATTGNRNLFQGLILAVFNIGISILGTLIWDFPKVKLKLQLSTTLVFLSNQQCNLNIITRKYEVNILYSSFGLLNDNFGILCYNLVGYNVNSCTFLTTDLYFFFCINPWLLSFVPIEQIFFWVFDIV